MKETWVVQCGKWTVSQIRNSIYSSNKHRAHIFNITKEIGIKSMLYIDQNIINVPYHSLFSTSMK